MKNLTIKKIKLAKVKDGDGLTITFSGTDPDNTAVLGEQEHKGLIHPDLRAATEALRPHLGILCGFIKESQVPDIATPDEKLLKDIHVSGISLGGSEDNPNVVITGRVTTYRGKSLALNSPVEFYDGPAESRYVYMDDLKAKIAVLIMEANAYYQGEKRGLPIVEEDPNQTKIDFPPTEKATAEGNLAGNSTKDQYANKDAMARVADLGNEKENGKKKGNGKRVVQSSQSPSGQEGSE